MKFRCSVCHKEIDFKSPAAFCPFCGGQMERVLSDNSVISGAAAVFLEEIKSVLSEAKSPLPDYSFIPTMDKEDYPFPSFSKIQKYIISATTTEKLFERLDESIINVRKYFANRIEETDKYQPPFLLKNIAERDDYLTRVVAILGETLSLGQQDIPVIQYHYRSSIPDDVYDDDLKLLDLTADLSKKCKRFVYLHSIFDQSCWIKEPIDFPSDIDDEKRKLEAIINGSKKLLEKNCTFDILDDYCKDVVTIMNWIFQCLEYLSSHSKKVVVFEFTSNGSPVKNLKDVYDEPVKKHYAPFEAMVPTILEKISSWDANALRLVLDKIQQINRPKNLTKNPTKAKRNSGDAKLDTLIGLTPVKTTIKMIEAYAIKNKGRKIDLHMCFEGNPGTGKTEVARIVAQILYEAGVLPENKVVEVDRGKLVAGYVGQTALKTQNAIEDAMGGVLFVDEAYELAHENDEWDYGSEAVATLIKGMEDHKGEFCVILAGYKNEMEAMLSTNPGFKSRIQFYVDFPNYSREELKEITKLMIGKNDYSCADDALECILDLTDYQRKSPHFGNAREARRFVEQAIMAQSMRTVSQPDSKRVIQREDVETVAKNNKISLRKNDGVQFAVTPEEKLAEMIGLASVKKTIAKIYATMKKNPGTLNSHMCFYGNPGTGKSEVARIMSTLLYEAGALPEAKFVETDVNGIMSKFVGSGGDKIQKKINEAMGGVLFLDEAYTLSEVPGGDEIIATLLKEMEDKRGQFAVILAGYKNEMEKMLSSNPGFQSRIQFVLNFEDYSRDELKEITKLMAGKKDYKIQDDALEAIAKITDLKRAQPNFANARDVRNILDQVIMNTSVRTISNVEDRTITLEDVTLYAEEHGFDITKQSTRTCPTNISVDCNTLTKLYRQTDDRNFVLDQKLLNQQIVSISDSQGQGTGFLISPDGFVLTCAHCLSKNKQNARVAFFTEDGQRIFQYFDFAVVGSDSVNDIALLKIVSDDFQFKFLPLALAGNVDYTPTKDFIMAGYPLGGERFRELSITTGKIASVNQIENNRTAVFADMFGKPGNSGSPTIDSETSKVIGIFWGGVGPKETMIPCFTPIDTIWAFLKTLQ